MPKPKSNKSNKVKRFHLKFTGHDEFSGSRKEDSNYYRRLIAEKKISYLHYLMENIDQLVIVSSFITPEIKSGLIDRFLVLAHHFNKIPFIVLTKSDLVDEETMEYYRNIYAHLYSTYIISCIEMSDQIANNTLTKANQTIIATITDHFKKHRTAIVGHSGVGKTSLLNIIDPAFKGMVNTVSEFTKRGRHTTTRIKKYDFSPAIGGGTVYDMPGLKELDFIDLSAGQLRDYYPEFKQVGMGCEFRDCTHIHEPICAVRKQLEEVEQTVNSKEQSSPLFIHPERYQNYLNIFNSLALK